MRQFEHPPAIASSSPSSNETVLALWQVNLLRVGYLVMGGGLAIFKWPLLFDHEPWTLAEGTVECLLVGMSLLALLGLRYPVRMLPILLFEVTWKLLGWAWWPCPCGSTATSMPPLTPKQARFCGSRSSSPSFPGGTSSRPGSRPQATRGDASPLTRLTL